ncbi:hypothetical protein VNI00_015929 [Paramarasmius palmivorus]|uniref:Uncharacterized protein n=1 Tax=Paramarasmius palmivorus TaxID=297713 RepID=A0AAW0BHH1_9AGAR
MLDESSEPLPLRTLEVVIDPSAQNTKDNHLEEILGIIQRTCPSLQTLCLLVPRRSDPAFLIERSSFLTKLTHINLSLSIDVVFMIMQLNRRSLISAQFAINVNLSNALSHAIDPDAEQAIIQAVRDKDPVTLPLLQNLSFYIKHIYEDPSLSHRHAAVLLDSISQVPSLQSLVVECNDYTRTSEGRGEGQLELFDSLAGFVTRNCPSSSCLRSLGLLNVPFNDAEALQLLRATPTITHLTIKEDFYSKWFDIFTSGFMKEMEITSGSKAALVPSLKYINLQFPNTKSDRDCSGIATMLKSRIGTLLSGYMAFPEVDSFDKLSVLSQLGMVLKVGIGQQGVFGQKAFI